MLYSVLFQVFAGIMHKEKEPAPTFSGPREVDEVTDAARAPLTERGQNRGPKKVEWSLYSVKKCLLDAIWTLEVS